MADRDGHEPDKLLEILNIAGIEPQITQILKDSSCKPKLEIKDDLITDIDYEVLQKCRKILFNYAVDMYHEQLAESGIHDKVTMEPIMRRTSGTTASDIIDIYMYVIGVVKYFPKGVLNNTSTYLDITTVRNEQSEDVGIAIKAMMVASNSGAEKTVPTDLCNQFETELGKLWTYLYNVEKVYNEKILQLEKKLGLRELNSMTESTDTNSFVCGSMDPDQASKHVVSTDPNGLPSQSALQSQLEPAGAAAIEMAGSPPEWWWWW